MQPQSGYNYGQTTVTLTVSFISVPIYIPSSQTDANVYISGIDYKVSWAVDGYGNSVASNYAEFGAGTAVPENQGLQANIHVGFGGGYSCIPPYPYGTSCANLPEGDEYSPAPLSNGIAFTAYTASGGGVCSGVEGKMAKCPV